MTYDKLVASKASFVVTQQTVLKMIIIMGLKFASASEDVIGDPFRPGTNNSELLEPRREERDEVLGRRASFHLNRTGNKDGSLSWKKTSSLFCVLSRGHRGNNR